MSINEKLAYLKGVVDSTEISSKATDRVVNAIVDLLDELVEEVNDIRDMSSDTDNEFDSVYGNLDDIEDRLDDIENMLDDISDKDFECYEDEDSIDEDECCDECCDECNVQDNSEACDDTADCDSCKVCRCECCQDNFIGEFPVRHGLSIMFECPTCGNEVFVDSEYLEVLAEDDMLIVPCDECDTEFGITLHLD